MTNPTPLSSRVGSEVGTEMLSQYSDQTPLLRYLTLQTDIDTALSDDRIHNSLLV